MSSISPLIAFHHLQQYYPCFFCTLIFLFFIKYNTQFSVKTRRIFIRAALSVLILAVSECSERLFSLLSYRTVMRSVLSAVNYSLKVFAVLFLLETGTRFWSKRKKLLNNIPALVNALFCIVSIPTGIVFYYDAGNGFHRGLLGFLPFIIGGFYLLEYFILGIHLIKKAERLDGIICIANTISVVLVIVFEASGELIGLLPNIAMISIIFYYLTLLLNRYSHDSLTMLYLRNRFYADVERVNKKTFVVSLDLNGLKKVNDTLGHAAGDAMLIAFSEAAMDELPAKANLYRMGGDEFSILYETEKAETVENLLAAIRSRLSRNASGITFSAGFDSFSSPNGFDPAFKAADQRMYEEKAAFKKTELSSQS